MLYNFLYIIIFCNIYAINHASIIIIKVTKTDKICYTIILLMVLNRKLILFRVLFNVRVLINVKA